MKITRITTDTVLLVVESTADEILLALIDAKFVSHVETARPEAIPTNGMGHSLIKKIKKYKTKRNCCRCGKVCRGLVGLAVHTNKHNRDDRRVSTMATTFPSAGGTSTTII